MNALLFGFARNNWAGLAVAGVILLGAWYLNSAAYSRGVADTESTAREAIFNQLEERNVTDETVSNMSPADKCKLLGGVLTDGRCR